MIYSEWMVSKGCNSTKSILQCWINLSSGKAFFVMIRFLTFESSLILMRQNMITKTIKARAHAPILAHTPTIAQVYWSADKKRTLQHVPYWLWCNKTANSAFARENSRAYTYCFVLHMTRSKFHLLTYLNARELDCSSWTSFNFILNIVMAERDINQLSALSPSLSAAATVSPLWWGVELRTHSGKSYYSTHSSLLPFRLVQIRTVGP